MAEIDAIATSLESEQVSLEESLRLFERAGERIAEAKRRLTELDHRFDVLTASFADEQPAEQEETQ